MHFLHPPYKPLFDFLLENRHKTLFEWDLLKIFHPEIKIPEWTVDHPEFLEAHFHLYRDLHHLDCILEKNTLFRIGMVAGIFRLIEKEPFQCACFEQQEFSFCPHPKETRSVYCEKHLLERQQNLPEKQQMRGFYLNPDSLETLKKMDLTKKIRQFTFYLENYSRLHHAFELFSCGPHVSFRTVRATYYQKIKKIHPDSGEDGSLEKTQALNEAYQLLKLFYHLEESDEDKEFMRE